MVNKSFMNSFGPSYGQDDRTTFIYEKSQYEKLKPILDKIDITIYRDGKSADEKDLELIVRQGETPLSAEIGIELIPLQGSIGQIATRWTNNQAVNQRMFADTNKVSIGMMDEKEQIYFITIWYSNQTYKKEFPDVILNKEDIIKEQDFQQPIETHLTLNT